MTSPKSLTWADIRPRNTAFTASKVIASACDAQRAAGSSPGPILEGLFLASYDMAAAADGTFSQYCSFMVMRRFGVEGLRALPGQGASAQSPDWREIYDLARDGCEVYRAIWRACLDCRRMGFEYRHVEDALLRCARLELERCTEDARRYWYRQYDTCGARAAQTAKGGDSWT